MSHQLSPRQLEAAMTVVLQHRAALRAEDIDDPLLIHSTIEGETQLFELCDAYAERAKADELLIEQAKKRVARLEASCEKYRALVERMLTAADLQGAVVRPLYTASYAASRGKVYITDERLIPDEYMTKTPDKKKIADKQKATMDKDAVPGATRSNPGSKHWVLRWT